MQIEKNYPLKNLTTLKIGGPAKLFAQVNTTEKLKEIIKWGRNKRERLFVLGGGSNVLISDEGFEGLVLRLNFKETKIIKEEKDHIVLKAETGKDWDKFVAKSVENNWQGIECLSGIPGKLGAGLVQNIGAYGQEIGNSVVQVKCLDKETAEMIELENKECGFSYRNSTFKKRKNLIITEVTFKLKKGITPKLKYESLKKSFHNQEPTLKNIRERVLEIRKQKGMIIDQGEPNSKSVGSFFINPIINQEKLEKLQKITNNQIPSWKQNEKSYKIPAAWLIENAGFYKGYKYKNVGISSKHCLALINRENGTASELMELAQNIQEKVSRKYQIQLEIEPTLIGKF